MAPRKFIHGSEFNEEEFLADMKRAKDSIGEPSMEDANHMMRIVDFVRLSLVGGHLLLMVSVFQTCQYRLLAGGILAALMISTSRCLAWTIVGHHVSHGGCDRFQKLHPGAIPHQYKRGVFAVGVRRFFDWLDWMLPAAWDFEHNKMHHYHLSEEKDPDLLEHNMKMLQEMPLPVMVKYASMIVWFFTWKIVYYSPNTFKELTSSRTGTWLQLNWPKRVKVTDPITVFDLVRHLVVGVATGHLSEAIYWPAFAVGWVMVVAPMAIGAVMPALLPFALNAAGFWPFATSHVLVAQRALAACVLAEALTNMHSFIIIACNHAGDDMWRYSTPCKAYSAEFFLRCAYSSVNFETGNDFVDGLYGWLNYQIEHHMWPDLMPLQYRKLQPLVKSICKKHGVQYIQQNGLWRTWKMLQVAVGARSMPQCEAVLTPASQSGGGKRQIETTENSPAPKICKVQEPLESAIGA
eukprot:TRINITY_DN1871_c0_g1_i5.p2 TRINITY_DN1871_c0_g1~~TRINITY_DN1871_c0_g1_i5.p2  ORF type:complete len:464 (+),score=133.41 TRINITY_DN1871_c0_g1_i5:184-1575(+)